MRTPHRIVAALALGLTAALVVPSASAHAAAEDVTTALTLPHRLAPQLGTDAAGDQTLVTGIPDGRGRLAGLVVSRRTAGGTWGPEQALTAPAEGLSAPTLAVADDGQAVVAWFRGSVVYVRVADDAGAWGPTTTLRGLAPFGGLQVVVDSDGETAAVAATQESGSREIGVLRHGRWHTTANPGDGTPSIGLDDTGTLYAATQSAQRGGAGAVTVARYSPAGRWSQPQRLRGTGPMPTAVHLLVTPRGELDYLVGYADPHWRSTRDSELYFTTGYLLLHQHRFGQRLHQRWHGSGVVDVAATVDARGTVRMAYQQWGDRQGRRPTTIALRTVVLRALLEPRPVTLDEQPATLGDGDYDVAVAASAGTGLRTWWRALPVTADPGDARPSGDLHADGTVVSGTALADGPYPGDLLSTSASRTDAAWVQDASYVERGSYGEVVTDGTVVVASTP